MQEKERHRRSPVSPAWDACFVLLLGLAATVAAGGLQAVYPSLSREFTFNCCSGCWPWAPGSGVAHLCSRQQSLTFHQASGVW
jgi:hypothetical protein